MLNADGQSANWSLTVPNQMSLLGKCPSANFGSLISLNELAARLFAEHREEADPVAPRGSKPACEQARILLAHQRGVPVGGAEVASGGGDAGALDAWLAKHDGCHEPKSPLGKAITYLKNQRGALGAFLPTGSSSSTPAPSNAPTAG